MVAVEPPGSILFRVRIGTALNRSTNGAHMRQPAFYNPYAALDTVRMPGMGVLR